MPVLTITMLSMHQDSGGGARRAALRFDDDDHDHDSHDFHDDNREVYVHGDATIATTISIGIRNGPKPIDLKIILRP